MNNLLIQISHDELAAMIKTAVKEAMPTATATTTPEPYIKGIHQLAEFLQVSPVKAQQLKNSGVFPFWQDGRTLLFDRAKVREVMEKFNKVA